MNSIGSVTGLTDEEIRQLEQWEPKERPALLAWLKWSKGKKFNGGIHGKISHKAGFMVGFQMACEIFNLHGEEKKEPCTTSI